MQLQFAFVLSILTANSPECFWRIKSVVIVETAFSLPAKIALAASCRSLSVPSHFEAWRSTIARKEKTKTDRADMRRIVGVNFPAEMEPLICREQFALLLKTFQRICADLSEVF